MKKIQGFGAPKFWLDTETDWIPVWGTRRKAFDLAATILHHDSEVNFIAILPGHVKAYSFAPHSIIATFSREQETKHVPYKIGISPIKHK